MHILKIFTKFVSGMRNHFREIKLLRLISTCKGKKNKQKMSGDEPEIFIVFYKLKNEYSHSLIGHCRDDTVTVLRLSY